MKDYFNSLIEALIKEKEAEEKTYASLTQNKKMSERIEEGVTIYPLQFKEFTFNAFDEPIVYFQFKDEQNTSLFGINGKCRLFSQSQNEYIHASILKIQHNSIAIILHSDELPDWVKEGKIGLDALADSRTYDIQIDFLKKLIETEKGLAYQFYKPWQVGYDSEFFVTDENLNESQNKAVKNILSTSQFSIIHGPPGTGKTKTLVAAIKQLIKMNKRILVAAPTNAACDHICHEISKFYQGVLRVGNSFKISNDVSDLTLQQKILTHQDMQVIERLKKDIIKLRAKTEKYIRNFTAEDREERKNAKNDIVQIKKDIKSIQSNLKNYFLDKAQVICGTLIGLQTDDLKNSAFDIVLVDEAGQAFESAIWSLSNNAPKLVLAGDPMQLPPSLFSQAMGNNILGISLLETALKLNKEMHLLNVQYRMHKTIMQFSNQQFYQNQLTADPSVAELKIQHDLFEPIEFIDTAGTGFEEYKDENGSILNEGEIKIVQNRIAELYELNHQIAVISPYKKQVTQLIELIQLPIKINTIDSFQGQESDIIIISLVRSNAFAEIGFLKDYRRMNVAMTRAKRKLVIIGDSATISNDHFYQALLEYVENNGSYRSAYEFNEIF